MTKIEIVSDGITCSVIADEDGMPIEDLFQLISQCVVGVGYSQVCVDAILGD